MNIEDLNGMPVDQVLGAALAAREEQWFWFLAGYAAGSLDTHDERVEKLWRLGHMVEARRIVTALYQEAVGK